MKEYLHIKSHRIPLYRGYVVFIISNSVDKVKKYIPEFPFDHTYADTLLDSYRGKEGYFIVLNFDSPHRKIHFGTLMHEVMHVVDFVAEYRGIKLDVANDEPLTYLAEWVGDMLWKFLGETGFRNKII